MTDKDEALRLALEALKNNRRTHHYCEDTWYSCPKHEDGCANDSEGDECNCGADEANAEIDQAITAIKAALLSRSDGEAKDEPVAWIYKGEQSFDGNKWSDEYELTASKQVALWKGRDAKPLYTTPPPVAEPHKRKPLTDEQIGDEFVRFQVGGMFTPFLYAVRAIEAAHGIIDPTDLKGEA